MNRRLESSGRFQWACMRMFAVAALSAVLAACGDGGGGGGGSSVAAAAPAPTVAAGEFLAHTARPVCSYEHVDLTVRALRLRQEGVAGQPWREVVLAAPTRIDLLNLQGGLLAALGAAPLAPGHYTQIRLVLVDDDLLANAVQPTGASLVPLTVPGGTSSGLKLDGDFDVPVGRSADVLLEGFEPCQAIVGAGNSGRLQLKPQLRARLSLLPVLREFRLDADEVIAVPGGGFAAVKRAADAVDVQRYSVQGEPVGNPVRISLDGVVVGDSGSLALTALANSGYALSWLGPPLTGSPFPPYPVMVRFHDASGLPVTAAQQVGTTQTFRSPVVQWSPPVTAALGGGGFVIAWAETQNTMLSQPFDATGHPIGTSRVSGLGGLNIRVAGLASGGYLLVSGLTTLVARAYGADGAELSEPRTVVADTGWTPFSSIDVALGALADGGAVVSWFTATVNQPGRFFLRRLQADATPAGDPVQVSSGGASPQVAGLGDGNILVMWSGLIRPFTPDAVPLRDPVQLDIPSTSLQAIRLLPIGGAAFLVAWVEDEANGGRSLHVRLYTSVSALSA